MNQTIKNILLKMVFPLCICHKCPSYPKKDPKVYCERAKSDKKIEEKGCICDKCLVWKLNRFSNYYYCIEGKDEKSKI